MLNFFGPIKKWITGIKQQKKPIWEVSLIFLKLGILAFGGPAAHIAMMENEFVQKRQWLDRTRFLELVGASNLIPGPTSTELAIYLGYLRAGWPGLILAGTFFILPAMIIVLPTVKLSMTAMFLIFLKIGAIVYGSGYVLLPFLWTDFVQNYQVLTSQQLLDAVAVGQFTPGPVFTTATFIGYIIAGIPGAIISTIAIFLPSFIFVPFINAFLGKIKTSVVASDFLSGVIVASLALMASVTWTLTLSSVVDWPTAVIAVVSVIAIFKYNLSTTWLIVAGGLIGLFKFFTG